MPRTLNQGIRINRMPYADQAYSVRSNCIFFTMLFLCPCSYSSQQMFLPPLFFNLPYSHMFYLQFRSLQNYSLTFLILPHFRMNSPPAPQMRRSKTQLIFTPHLPTCPKFTPPNRPGFTSYHHLLFIPLFPPLFTPTSINCFCLIHFSNTSPILLPLLAYVFIL